MANKRIVWPLIVTLILAIEGSGVKLVASSGTLTRFVPDVVGKTDVNANQVITAAGLNVVNTIYIFDNIIPLARLRGFGLVSDFFGVAIPFFRGRRGRSAVPDLL
jgi:hypothetical protein